MRRVLIGSYLVASCTAGCAMRAEPVALVSERLEEHRLLVQLENVADRGGESYAHPSFVDETVLTERIASYLAELRFGRWRSERQEAVFPAASRERLAQGLALGLGTAGPDERVVFVVATEDRVEGPWFTPSQRQTRGVAFIDEEGRFHLAFDLIGARPDPNDPDPHDPTQRAQSRGRLISDTGQPVTARSGQGALLWVAWDDANSRVASQGRDAKSTRSPGQR